MADMQRLVQDYQLRVSSVHSWRKVTPKVLKQVEVEAIHNVRLRAAIPENLVVEEGVYILAM